MGSIVLANIFVWLTLTLFHRNYANVAIGHWSFSNSLLDVSSNHWDTHVQGGNITLCSFGSGSPGCWDGILHSSSSQRYDNGYMALLARPESPDQSINVTSDAFIDVNIVVREEAGDTGIDVNLEYDDAGWSFSVWTLMDTSAFNNDSVHVNIVQVPIQYHVAAIYQNGSEVFSTSDSTIALIYHVDSSFISVQWSSGQLVMTSIAPIDPNSWHHLAVSCPTLVPQTNHCQDYNLVNCSLNLSGQQLLIVLCMLMVPS